MDASTFEIEINHGMKFAPQKKTFEKCKIVPRRKRARIGAHMQASLESWKLEDAK